MRSKPYSNKVIFAWCLYDWAISAFPVIVTTFVFAAFFTGKVAKNSVVGTEQWGNAIALSAVMIAILSPILGAVADHSGQHKRWLGLFTSLQIISTFLLWFIFPNAQYAYFMLALMIVGTVALNVGNVFYNAMLPHLTTRERMGRISGWGWGLGYFGGLTILFIAYWGFVKHAPLWLNQATYEEIRICGPLVAIWILLFSWPIFLWGPQIPTSNLSFKCAYKRSWNDIRHSIRIIFNDKNLLIFFIAQMIYLDGLNTLFAFAGIYAAGTFKLPMSQVLLLGIMMNTCAGIGAIILAFVTDWIGAKRTILWSLFFLTLFGLGVVLTHQQILFWVLGGGLSLFVGALQSASRTLLAKLVPRAHETMMFGFSALTGKVSAPLGPLFLSLTTAQFNSQRAGMSTILIFFIVGYLLLRYCQEPHFK